MTTSARCSTASRVRNGDVAGVSREAALYELWLSSIMRRLVGERIGEGLYRAYTGFREIFVAETLPAMLAHSTDRVDPEALRSALDEAIEEGGGRTWGEIHALVLAHPLARIPGLDVLFTAATLHYGGDESTMTQGAMDPLRGHRPAVIPSWRAVWDLGDLERSVGVVPSGVSGNPASPHWADQSKLFEAGRGPARGLRDPGRGDAHPATGAGTIEPRCLSQKAGRRRPTAATSCTHTASSAPSPARSGSRPRWPL